MSGFSTRLEEVYIFQETRKSVPANQKVISIGYSLIRISLPWQFKVSFSWCIMIVVHQKSWCCRIYLFIFWLFRFGPFLWAALQSWKTLPVGSAFRVVEMTSSDFFFIFFFNRQKPCWSHSSPLSSPTGQMKTFIPLSLCDTARLCIFLLCSSSTSPLYSSYIFSPLTCHDRLSCTPLFLPGPPKNQNVTAKTHPVLSHSKHIIYTHYAF